MKILQAKTPKSDHRGNLSEVADSDSQKVWRIIIDKIEQRHRKFLFDRNFKWSKEYKNYSRIYDQRIPALAKDAREVMKELSERGASWKLIYVSPPVRYFRKDKNILDFGMQYTGGRLQPSGKGWWKQKRK